MAFDEYGGLDPEAESFDSFAQCLLRTIVSEPRASRACCGPGPLNLHSGPTLQNQLSFIFRFSEETDLCRSRYMDSGSQKAPDFYTGAQTHTHTHAHTHVRTHTHIHTHTHTHTHTHGCADTTH